MSDFTFGLDDIRHGLTRYHLAFEMGREDLRDRYSRSLIGMGWIAIGFLLFLSVKAVIFSELNVGLSPNFMLHLTIGYALWTLISQLVITGSSAFTVNSGWLMSSSLPYSFYIMKGISAAFIDFSLVATAAVLFVALFSTANPFGLLFIIPALSLYALSGFGLSMLLAPIAARYRDLIYFVQTAMRILFFATPIIWVQRPGTLLADIANYNVVYHYIEIVRRPFMDGTVPVVSWLVVITSTLLLFLVGFVIFSRTKRSIPLWM